jgi:kynureninase
MDPLLRWRDQFPILQETTYLVSHSMGAMPVGVRHSLATYADLWGSLGVRAWESEYLDAMSRARQALAEVIGASAGEITLLPNVSVAEAGILSCFDFSQKRNKIVFTEMNFPSVMYLCHAHESLGARVVMVPSDDGVGVDTERLLEAIDEETLLVPVSHVFFRSSFVQDVPAIVERAHAVGAYVVLDVYQSAGVMPIDVRQWGVDFAVGGTIKWLCGGPACGYLYVREELRPKLFPRVTGWFAHEAPFRFEVGPIRYRNDAERFANGTPNIPGVFAVLPGLEIIREVGTQAIREKSLRLTRRLIRRAQEIGLTVRTPIEDDRRGGVVVVDFPGAEATYKRLLDEGILVDYRPNAGIRISPHFYTTEEECDRVIDAITALRQR